VVFRVAILVLAGSAFIPSSARALDDPVWHAGGGFGVPARHTDVIEFDSNSLVIAGGAGFRLNGAWRASLDVQHLFFQVPNNRVWIATVGTVEEERSQLTTATLGVELAPTTWNRSGPLLQAAAGAARVAFGEIRGTAIGEGDFTIARETAIRPVLSAGFGFLARPSTGHGPGLQGLVRLIHVPDDAGANSVVTTSLEVVF
jgi:hypothetical protein